MNTEHLAAIKYVERMQNVALVTGGAGFIGSHLTRRLLAEKWIVDVVDDMSAPTDVDPALASCNLFESDFAHPDVLSRVRAGRYDVIFHTAALPRVSYSMEHPVETFDVNVNRTMHLIDACRLSSRKPRFVFSSSSSVYGNGAVTPTSEHAIRLPASPYAQQKATVEDYLGMYARLYELESVCLRYFNVFGPGQLGTSPYATAIAAWMTALMHGRPLRSDGDGTQSRDMCYVDDVVDANLLAAEHGWALQGRSFNVGSGVTHTNNEILGILLERYPWAQIKRASTRPGDVKTTHADISHAREVLGYVPRVHLHEGLRRTFEWYELQPRWPTHTC